LIRIAEKIESNEIEPKGPFRVTDMIRARIKVAHPSEIIAVYAMICKLSDFDIVRITNHLN